MIAQPAHLGRMRLRTAWRQLAVVAILSLLAGGCSSTMPATAGVVTGTQGQPPPASAPVGAASGVASSAAAGSAPAAASSTVPIATSGLATQATSPATTVGTAPTAPAAAVNGPQPVPADLRPPLSDPAQGSPIIYTDGCHLRLLAVVPPECAFGVRTSPTTVVLIGDSKAAQWFPALQLLAAQHQWRLVSLTKSSCTAVDVPIWNGSLGRTFTECDTWRRNVITRVKSEHPALVIVSDDRLYQLSINGGPVPLAQRPEGWNAGLERTLRALSAGATTVVLLGDTPRSRYNTPVCLSAHLSDARACATPLARAADLNRLAADGIAAAAAGAHFVDPTRWVCPSDPCPPILRNLLVYREQDHLTAAFIVSLAPRLSAALGLP